MMQTDVLVLPCKRIRADCTGFEARLKSIVVTSGAVGARSVALVDSTGALTGTWDRPAGTPGPITTNSNYSNKSRAYNR
jgi:hypothetical protein